MAETKAKMGLGKKIMIGIGGFIVLLIVVGFGIKQMYLTPVAPKKLCEHVFDLSLKEAEKRGMKLTRADIEKSGLTMEKCEQQMKAEQENKFYGKIKMTKASKCQIKAQTVEEMKDCTDNLR